MARSKPKRSGAGFGVAESLAAGRADTTPSTAAEPATEETPPPQEPTPPAAPAPAVPSPEQAPTPATTRSQPVLTRKSTVTRPAPAPTGERGVAALEGQHPDGGGGATPAGPHPDAREVTADYAAPPWHPRMKDPTASTSRALIDEIQAMQADWTSANRARLSDRGQPPPTNSGFREALLRLGLKHLNDPEFIDLIPPDARRNQRR